jgi:putative hemolysin
MTTHRLFTSSDSASQYGSLTVSIATGAYEILETLRLRHQVFVKEMRANLRRCTNEIVEDEFDQHCRHIVVRDNVTGEVVGSTRLLLQDDVGMAGMFFTETGFDLEHILKLPGQFMEIGRHCIHADYRNGEVLRLLWEAIIHQMLVYDIDHLLACVSLPMDEDGAYAHTLVAQLPARHFIPKHLRAIPRLPLPMGGSSITLPLTQPASLKTYLRMGALICGDVCWDPVFNCADVLVLVHRSQLAPRHARHIQLQRNDIVSAVAGVV